MDNRRLLLALLLSTAVIIVWSVLVPPEPPRSPAPEVAAEPGAAPTGETPEGAPPEGAGPAGAAVPTAPAEAIEDAAEEHLLVETVAVRAEFTNRGAQLLSFRLKGHRGARLDPVDLVRERAAGPYPFAVTTPSGTPLPLNEALFVGGREDGAEGPVLAFRYAGPLGTAEKRFLFRADGLIELRVSVSGGEPWGLLLGPGIRNPSAIELEDRFAQRSAVYRLGEKVEPVAAQSAAGIAEVPGGGLRWAGLEDTYFLTALVPREPLDSVLLRPMLMVPDPAGGPPSFSELPPKDQLTDAQEDLPRELTLVARARGGTIAALAYFGAKQYDQLAAYELGLERTVQWGWFGTVVRGLLWALQKIHAHIVPNYGWAIILMTVLIKIALFPLTYKSLASMQKMQRLNPLVQAIRDKYRGKLRGKDNKPNLDMQRKMNEEIMALYKGEGVNPAGGCLPLLLQIPILFAFYRLLYTAVELRHSPWILWIRDLSAYDPYYVLPIIMGGTQFLQTKLTPAAGDPLQRRIFLMMPLLFTVLFLKFPSGLVLYWLTNNVLTIAQQLIYNRMRRVEAEPQAPGGRSQRKRPPPK